ncbi:hypothetical protein Trydic_g9445 [Trypoxylus dichotomus]
MKVLLLIVITIVLSECRAKPTTPVTHEDIRNVILMLVRVMSATEDKLRRHELRERSVVPVMGTAARLDERISDVEKTLLTNDIKDNNQMEEIKNLLVDIKTSFPVLMEKVKADILLEIKSDDKVVQKTLPQLESSEESTEVYNVEETVTLSNKIDALASSIQYMQEELADLKKEQHTRELNNKFDGYIDKFERLLTNNENLLKKFENKFETDEVLPQDDTQLGWQATIMQALERTEDDVEDVLEEVKHANTKTTDLIRNLEKKIAESESNTEKKMEIIAKQTQLIPEIIIARSEDLDVKVKTLNASIEDIKDKISQINRDEGIKMLRLQLNNTETLLGEYKAKLTEYDDKLILLIKDNTTETKNDQYNKILQVLEEQKTVLNQTKFCTTQKNSSDIDLQSKILKLLEYLELNIDDASESSRKLLDRIENILINEEQMLDFSRQSSQQVIDTIETLSINTDFSLTEVKESIKAILKK